MALADVFLEKNEKSGYRMGNVFSRRDAPTKRGMEKTMREKQLSNGRCFLREICIVQERRGKSNERKASSRIRQDTLQEKYEKSNERKAVLESAEMLSPGEMHCPREAWEKQ